MSYMLDLNQRAAKVILRRDDTPRSHALRVLIQYEGEPMHLLKEGWAKAGVRVPLPKSMEAFLEKMERDGVVRYG